MGGANPFEAGTRKVIPAVLIYPRWRDQILMIHRDSGRPGDYHAGKWNGLGGKLEADESPLEAAVRELREESGLEPGREAFRSLGVLQFPNFKAHKSEDWVCWIYSARIEGGSAPKPVATHEGSLHWVPAADLLKLNLWPGDREFIPHVLAGRPFVGTSWYQGEKLLRSDIAPL